MSVAGTGGGGFRLEAGGGRDAPPVERDFLGGMRGAGRPGRLGLGLGLGGGAEGGGWMRRKSSEKGSVMEGLRWRAIVGSGK